MRDLDHTGADEPTRYDPSRPVLLLHVPKTGGTALRTSMVAALAPTRLLSGFDRCLFGGFSAFETVDPSERQHIYLNLDELPRGADMVAGHMALSTLLSAYPSGQLMITLREPICRMLSHWAYWRGRSDAELAVYGEWADTVRGARAPLDVFLDDPRAACQTDNVATRMLLYPDPAIPVDGFIDPVNDAALVAGALRRLALFSVTEILEGPRLTLFRTWLGRSFRDEVSNETPASPSGLTTALTDHLTPTAFDRLERNTRLDLMLWRSLAGAIVDHVDTLRMRTLLRAVAHHATLLAGGH